MAELRNHATARSALHLLHRAGQRADELFAENVGKIDITPRQFAVLKAVGESDEPSQTLLVTRTGIDRSTLADIVRRLVERGMLQRRRTRHDARMYAVKLTSSGQSAVRGAEPAAKKTDERLLAPLSATERDSLLKLLSRIVAQMQNDQETSQSGRRNAMDK